MPKKQTKPKYPKEFYVRFDSRGFFDSSKEPNALFHPDTKSNHEAEIAIYQFIRMAKVKRTVTVQ